MTKMLSNIRVIEMGTYITGPAAGMHLADLGADVIKIERPGEGDPFRAFKGGLYSPHFQTYNRNKRSIALDSKEYSDLKILHQLIEGADVFIQNFRPGVAEKLGVGEATLRSINPKLVYCAISGFGQSGPSRDRPSFDTVAQAASGYLRLLTPPDRPRVIGPAIADSVTGQYAAMGIMAALLERGSTGKGRRLDISMLEAMMHFNLDSFTHYLSVGEVMGPLSRPQVSQSYTFQCADDKWIAFHLSSPTKFWEALTESVGRADLQTDSRFADRLDRIKNQDALIDILTPIFANQTRDYWCDTLNERGVPNSPAYDSNEALDDPQAIHLKIAVESEHPEMGKFRTVRSPFSFDGKPSLEVNPPPTLNEHGDEIRQEMNAIHAHP
ncbi:MULTISPECIES: CaiB/BaiF CoA transferase family protein [unclassified Halomonas]|uniref:CaiB/BaiF CoA transferase family protein n=1 Tax=unclassified Halomonas TaxID=2609666 RepID=UPI000489859F|nr:MULTISPECIES: CoA transferase [unclassified Halomonas]PKH59422.1 CoA transferase [Halomonas sp. Choline-3u-9]QGQ70625.1 CoA transferase [Halomonas sp. PA16-9]